MNRQTDRQNAQVESEIDTNKVAGAIPPLDYTLRGSTQSKMDPGKSDVVASERDPVFYSRDLNAFTLLAVYL